MATDRPSSPPDSPDGLLDSWKAIAQYLNRDESTVQRWEKRERMPVHRHVHEKRGSVYAYRAELDGWWQGRRERLEPEKGNGAGIPPEAAPDLTIADAGRAAPERWRRRWMGIAAALVLIPIGVLAWTWFPSDRTASSPRSATFVPLTSTSGLNVDPALSPDGSLLAFASDRDGTGDLDIWVQPVGGEGEQPRRITSEPGDEREPSFSPTGSSIVFSKGNAGGIHIVDTVGGTPRLLVTAEQARAPRFSPDGRWVTYWTGVPDRVAPTARAALFVVPAAGGSPRTLVSDFGHARYGTWSPDGNSLLFVGERAYDQSQSTLDWYVVHARGGDPIRTGAFEVLRRAGIEGMAIPWAWTAEDGTVVFTAYGQGTSNVWKVAISTATGHVTGEPEALTFGTAIERSPTVSSAGQVAFASVEENIDVWRLPLDAKTGLATGAIEQVTDNAAVDQLANLSDDGRTMAFMSSRTGQERVWVRDVQGGGERQVTHDGTYARISRDGSTLAVVRGGPHTYGTDLLSLADGRRSPLCDNCAPGDWSPDGTRLIVRQGRPSRRLVERDLGSSRERELAVHSEWNLLQPRFSDDGQWIVFHTAINPTLRQVYAIPASSDSSIPVEAWILVVADFGVYPSWARDGSAVYYFSMRDGAMCAWLQPVDRQTKRPIDNPVAVQHFHRAGLRAATGAGATSHIVAGYLYVTLTSSKANIWMLDR